MIYWQFAAVDLWTLLCVCQMGCNYYVDDSCYRHRTSVTVSSIINCDGYYSNGYCYEN